MKRIAKTMNVFLNGKLYGSVKIEEACDRFDLVVYGWKRQFKTECSGRGVVTFSYAD